MGRAGIYEKHFQVSKLIQNTPGQHAALCNLTDRRALYPDAGPCYCLVTEAVCNDYGTLMHHLQGLHVHKSYLSMSSDPGSFAELPVPQNIMLLCQQFSILKLEIVRKRPLWIDLSSS